VLDLDKLEPRFTSTSALGLGAAGLRRTASQRQAAATSNGLMRTTPPATRSTTATDYRPARAGQFYTARWSCRMVVVVIATATDLYTHTSSGWRPLAGSTGVAQLMPSRAAHYRSDPGNGAQRYPRSPGPRPGVVAAIRGRATGSGGRFTWLTLRTGCCGFQPTAKL
jgi:hypothetical protein